MNNYPRILVLIFLFFIFLAGAGDVIASPPEIVTILDSTGKSVEIHCPLERIVSLSAPASEIICGLGSEDKIIGVSSNSIFPPSLDEITKVGDSSFKPNMEIMLELEPDLIIADSMLSDENRKTFEDAGIPVIIESFVDLERLAKVVDDLGLILDQDEKADQLTGFIEDYLDIIQTRTADLTTEEKPSVYLERGWAYHTASSKTPSHDRIVAAGGINIASNETLEYPLVSAEWIAERDPEIIVREVWITGGETPTEEDLIEIKYEITTRPGLSEVSAVLDGRVYLLSSKINSGIRSIVGELYFAKWFHPELFEDIDPEAVHQELIKSFFDIDLEGVYVYQ